MIGKLITDYLASHNRIIIPSFGAFIKRPDGQIVFMSLLKADDGILVRLMAEERGCSETEARRQIDLYAARLNDFLSLHKKVAIEGFGFVVTSPSGENVFTTDRSLYDERADKNREKHSVSVSADSFDDDAIQTEPVISTSSETKPDVERQRRAIVELFDEDDTPAPNPGRTQSRSQTPNGHTTAYRTGQGNTSAPSQARERDLRPSGTRPAEATRSAGQDIRRPSKPAGQTVQENNGRVNIRRPQKKKGKVDLVIIFAMVAILLAIIAVIYGMGDKNKGSKQLDEELYNTSVIEGGIPVESVYMED